MNHINSSFTISEQTYSISSLEEDNLEFIRKLKNRNRNAFFAQSYISKSAQREWFEAYRDREYDTIFILSNEAQYVGCMGIRKEKNEWDLYNVLIAKGEHSGQGVMSAFLRKIVNYQLTIEDWPVRARVLTQNTAVQWYYKNNFVIESDEKEYIVMRYSGEIS